MNQQQTNQSCVLITGANRGLGLEFVHQYVQSGVEVIACCRQPERARDLLSLSSDFPGLINIRPMDVSNEAEIRAVSAELSGQPIDVLINNAGIYGPKGVAFDQPVDTWMEVLRINTVAPVKVAEAFMPQVLGSDKRTIANITSKMGSIADNGSGGNIMYRSSKAALNAAMKSLALDHADQGLVVLQLHPGWVRTDMGGPNGLIDAPESVQGMRKLIADSDLSKSGAFFAYDGKAIPW